MTSPRLQAFLAALPLARDDEFVTPPGMGGAWLAKHVRSGLKRRVLVASDEGIVFAHIKGHGVCENCARERGSRNVCTHCNCVSCIWEREVESRGGPMVEREKVLQLVARLKAFRFGQVPAVSVPALDDDL